MSMQLCIKWRGHLSQEITTQGNPWLYGYVCSWLEDDPVKQSWFASDATASGDLGMVGTEWWILA